MNLQLLPIALLALSARAAAFSAPSRAQADLLNVQFTQFMHFGPCTFVDCQWDIPPASPSVFNPTNLDAEQWVRTAQAWGADEICLTTRHVDGFTLWPSKATNYSVAASPWKNGTGDVVADFVAAARKYGMRVCFYFIPSFDVNAVLANVSAGEYLAMQQTMLTELLSEYGHVDRLWIDNYALDSSQYQPYWTQGFECAGNELGPSCPSWQAVVAHIRAVSPDTAIVPGPDGCLVNGEVDGGTYPVYHYATQGSYSCNMVVPPSPASNLSFVVVESDYSVLNPGDNWFWNPSLPFLDVGSLWSQVTLKAGQGANLILNVPPDTTGQIPAEYVQLLQNFSDIYHATYDVPVAALLQPVSAPCPQLSFIVPVADPTAVFDQVVTSEDMSAGQLITGYSIEYATAEAPDVWLPLPVVHGQTVGRRIVDFGEGDLTGVSALRWNCTASLDDTQVATISSFGAFLGAPLPGRK